MPPLPVVAALLGRALLRRGRLVAADRRGRRNPPAQRAFPRSPSWRLFRRPGSAPCRSSSHRPRRHGCGRGPGSSGRRWCGSAGAARSAGPTSSWMSTRSPTARTAPTCGGRRCPGRTSVCPAATGRSSPGSGCRRRPRARCSASSSSYLMQVRAAAAARGLSFAAFCYARSAEERWMLGLARRYAGHARGTGCGCRRRVLRLTGVGRPAPGDQAELRRPRVAAAQGAGRVDRVSWRDPEPGGENSMAWYRAAVARRPVGRPATGTRDGGSGWSATTRTTCLPPSPSAGGSAGISTSCRPWPSWMPTRDDVSGAASAASRPAG